MGGKIVWLLIGGGLGALSRYYLAGLIQRMEGLAFPAGTFAVNMLGCFLFGFFWTLAEDRIILGPEVRVVVLTGFLGAFTTFSTFIFETQDMMRLGQWFWVFLNIFGQNLGGLLLLVAGMALARFL